MIGKWLARGSSARHADLDSLLENDFQRAGVEVLGVHDIEIDGADLDLGARLPDEIHAEDFGMQRADEDADAPQRHAGLDQTLAAFRHHRLGFSRRPRAVDQPVHQVLKFRRIHLHSIGGKFPVSQADIGALRLVDVRAKSGETEPDGKC